MAQKEIPCYLFVGMLESGKTKFIQETMEDPQFDSGDKTLLLICEEGEEEYDSERFAFGGVTVATIEDKAELNREHLQQLAEKSDCGRVIIEYNGMWLVQELYDALPDTVTVDGKAYRIYTDYRDWLRFYDMQEDDGLSKREKLLLMLEWYIDKPPLSCLEEALEALIGFATRSEEQPEQRQEHSGRKTTDRVLSWQYDAAYVYAAFLSVYHMDLQQVGQMHWHLFLGLFDALPDETPIKQRMGYRSVNLAEIKNKNERLRIRKIQDRIRIPQPELDGYQCGAFFG